MNAAFVIAGLDPAIHVFRAGKRSKTRMPAPSAA
jgi:hypothetical protein